MISLNFSFVIINISLLFFTCFVTLCPAPWGITVIKSAPPQVLRLCLVFCFLWTLFEEPTTRGVRSGMASRRKVSRPAKQHGGQCTGLRSQVRRQKQELQPHPVDTAWDIVPSSSPSSEGEEEEKARLTSLPASASMSAQRPEGELFALMRDFLAG